MKKTILNKIITLGIIILFIGICGFPSTAIKSEGKHVILKIRGNILYVGGTGVGNYTTIQDAVNDAFDGDTVFVFDDSSPYYEHIIVNKAIDLVGENRDTTIIDGSSVGTVISFMVSWVNFSSFAVQNGSTGIYLDIKSDNNHLVGNNIINNEVGIDLYFSYYNTFTNNLFENNSFGIKFTDGCSGHIFNNNDFINNKEIGLKLISPVNSRVLNNNFIGNKRHLFFEFRGDYGLFPIKGFLEAIKYSFSLTIKNNYWDQYREKPFLIEGKITTSSIPWFPVYSRNWWKFDWYPAAEPNNYV